jgi:hypothetical protein
VKERSESEERETIYPPFFPPPKKKSNHFCISPPLSCFP